MAKHKMPNEGKGTTHTSGGTTNKGPSTGLRKEAGTNQGAMKPPSNKNPYPSGLS